MTDEDPNIFELKVAGIKIAGGAAGIIAGIIGFNIANGITGNFLIGCMGAFTFGTAAYAFTGLKVSKMHTSLDYPPPKLYRLDDQQVLATLVRVFDENPFVDPIDSMPHDWRVKPDAEEGKFVAKMDYQEKWGHEFTYKEAHIKETIEKRHISVTITVKQEPAGTSVTQVWTVISPKRRDYANKTLRQMQEHIHARLKAKEQPVPGSNT